MTDDTYSISWGRDYTSPLHGRYEYCIYLGEKLVARMGGFTSSSTAKRAGLKAAQDLQAKA